ncbi:peptidase M12A astacin [Pseudomonas sp. B6002]|uniref:M12 family metallopeptidase n=1 Tax=Pseudomonas sp. B6002 TaxID=2726978 RepID=UPI0015A1FB7D|nr:M12 family metallopeptidase [Pseudomonas sp. B6002]NVZ49262.1 peptidase M12A astacin [Pseudomonas sp. B6002]
MINNLSRYAYNDPALIQAQIAEPTLIRHARGIASTQYLWPQGSTLNISIFDMPEKAIEYIKKNINLWQPYTNLKFNFINTRDGDIRISGKDDGSGNWSAIGTEAKLKPLHEPTMHIDLLQTADMLNHTIRHEFGHALGLLHEHQHPDNEIQWDKEKLYEESGKLGHTRQDTDENFLNPPDSKTTITSTYDSRSVMHYKVPAEVTSNGVAVAFNEDISEGDKQFIALLYPPTHVQLLDD